MRPLRILQDPSRHAFVCVNVARRRRVGALHEHLGERLWRGSRGRGLRLRRVHQRTRQRCAVNVWIDHFSPLPIDESHPERYAR